MSSEQILSNARVVTAEREFLGSLLLRDGLIAAVDEGASRLPQAQDLGGDILVAEDGGDMQMVVIDSQGNIAPLLQVTGQDESEITGPAFSPDGSCLYFSSQRGSDLFNSGKGFGITYEIRGPFADFVML